MSRPSSHSWILTNGRFGTFWHPEGIECDGRIMYTMKHPKKGTKEFKNWLSGDFKPRYYSAMHDEHNVCLFTDGSQKDQEGRLVSGAAWTIIQPQPQLRGGIGECLGNHLPPVIVKEGLCGGGKRTSYDCEMLTISRGLQDASPFITDDITTLVVFADNESAVRKSMRPANGPSSLAAIRSCTSVRKMLTQFPNLVINFCWFPAHITETFGEGLPNFNDHVDKLAKKALEEPQPAYVSLAMAQQRLMARAKKEWTESTQKPQYIGRHYLHTADSNKAKYTEIKVSKHGFLSKHGDRHNTKTARLIRFLTGHFPHRDF